MARILFIEDETDDMPGMVKSLENRHSVAIRGTGSDALLELRVNHGNYDIILLDLMLPRGKPESSEDEIPPLPPEKVGEYIFDKLGKICPDKPVLMLTAMRSDLSGLRKAKKVVLLNKPVRMSALLSAIDGLL